MKKVCLFILIVYMAAALFGCSSPTPPEAAASATPAVPASTPEQIEMVLQATPEPTALPTPEPTEAPTPTPEPTATPAPADLLTAADGTYTIAWISDTQHYSKKFPDTFKSMTRWLSDNRERLNLQFLVHTGDLVHNMDDEAQWKNAVAAMDLLGDIPYGTLAGNHDVGGSQHDFSTYTAKFGKRTQKQPYFGGSYENGRCHYDLIDAGKTAYVFVFISCGPDSGCISWANKVLAKYPDRVGILCTHSYLTTDLQLSKEGQTLHDKVVKKNPNLYMVLCGDDYNSYCIPESFDDDGDGTKERTVLQMICNYQAAGSEGGSGYMRLMRVDEAAGTITFLNYSPLLDDFVYYDLAERMNEKYVFTPGGEEGTVNIPWHLS